VKTDLVLAKAEVNESAVSFAIQDYVLRLQVTVDDVDAVQVLNGQKDLGQVEGGHGLVHPVGLLQKTEKVSAGIILCHEEDLLFCLEHADELHLQVFFNKLGS